MERLVHDLAQDVVQRFYTLLFATLLAAPVGAEPSPRDDDGHMRVVGTPAPDEAERDHTGFAQILSLDEVEGAAADLGDVLEGATGTYLRRTGGAGRAQHLQIRGAGAHQIAVFLDEVPLSGARGGALDLSTIPPAFLEEAVLLRGAAGAMAGGGAQGGVLQLKTRTGAFGKQSRGRLRMGSYGLTQLDAAHAVGDGTRDGLVAIAMSRADGDFTYRAANDGAVRERANHDHQQGGGLLRLRQRLGGGRLGLLIEGAGLERGEPGVEQYESLHARSTQRRLQSAVSWVGDAGLSVVTYARLDGYAFEDPAPPIGGAVDLVREDSTVGARGRGHADVGAHRIGLAVEGRRERGQTEGTETRTDTRTSGALVGSERWQPSKYLSVLGVLRLDAASGRAPVWIPKVGGRFGPLKGLTMRANVGRSFRDPSFDELSFVGAGIRGNPDLRPEDGWSWDVGLQYLPSRRLSLEAVYFEQRYSRLVLFVPKGAYRIEATDDHGANLRGVEVAGVGRLGPLRVRASGAWLQHEDDAAPHYPLPHRPSWHGGGEASVPMGAARVFGRYHWRGEVHSDRLGQRTLPGYGRLDLGGTVGSRWGFTLGAEVRDVSDVGGLDAVQQPRPGRTVLFSLGWAD